MLIDVLRPKVPAGAYDQFRAARDDQARAHRLWQPADGPLPALFLGHGAPPLLDDPIWLDQLLDWSLSLPKPRGVVMVSAHWENAPIAVNSTAAGTPLFYDFGGFHPRYYTMPYPTPEATGLARRVVGALPQTTRVHHHVNRGLDHGAYIPLMAMYPLADVPVLQVSLPTLDSAPLLELGTRLRPLREEGILVVGSGFMTHWLYGPFDVQSQHRMPSFNAEFDAWAAGKLADGDVDALADFRHQAPGVAQAHRTVDHFVPLLVALGAARDPEAPATTVIEGVSITNSKRSVQLT
jgi:4,5-DOPA dioxygenase extradiol